MGGKKRGEKKMKLIGINLDCLQTSECTRNTHGVKLGVKRGTDVVVRVKCENLRFSLCWQFSCQDKEVGHRIYGCFLSLFFFLCFTANI